MAELKRRTRWKKWAPDLGENRDLPDGPALYLELAVDLTAEQLSEAAERIRQWDAEGAATVREVYERIGVAYTAALTPYVRVHGGPHTVDGETLATLADYVRLVQRAASGGSDQLKELMAALSSFNSIKGPDELFSLPRSGGVRTTDARSNDAAASPTANP